jgi:hypothetical protein
VGLDRVERLRQLFVRTGWYAIYGVARPEHLRVAGMDRQAFGHDVHALMRLLLLGDIVRVDEPLFEYRIESVKTPEDYQVLNSAIRTKTAYTDLFLALIQIVIESDWTEKEKEAVVQAAVCTLASENLIWRQQIEAESFGGRSWTGCWGFAMRLAWRLRCALPGGRSLGMELRRIVQVLWRLGLPPLRIHHGWS